MSKNVNWRLVLASINPQIDKAENIGKIAHKCNTGLHRLWGQK